VDDGTLIVGDGGDAALTIFAGAIAGAHEIIIGDGFTAVGSVLVTGLGSQLDTREELLIGYNGEATLKLACSRC
jgi:T5SS/PEP-CTERM-associated repeat protein